MSNPLDIRTCIAQVHGALVDVLDLAYSVRYPEAADLAALAARAAEPLPDRALVFVASEGVVFRWTPASRLDAIPGFVVAPDVPLQTGPNGRWIRQSSSVTLGPAYFRPLHRVRQGFAHCVQIYEGQSDAQLERIYNQAPAYLVEWISDELQVKGYRHGSIYQYDLRFVIHCIARNLRADASVLVGSEVPGETEPGLYDLIGAARYLLAGCALGLSPGVKFTDVTGPARIVEMGADSDLAQRRFRAEIEVVVHASVHIVDEDLFSNPEVWVERRDAGTPAGASFDASNYVALGYGIAPQPGLVAAPAQGAAYIAGQIVTSVPGAIDFPPEADTYRDLRPDGSFDVLPVEIGTDPPPQRPGSLRLGLTRTDATAIVADKFLCSFLVPSGANPGEPFRAA